MPIKYLPPKSDLIFKKIFGDVNNIEILTAFLKSTLDIAHDEYEKIILTDTHLSQNGEHDKLGILDVKVQTKSGNIIDIEIQLANIPHMRERIVFYLSKMVSGQISSGDKYNSIKRSIIIVITDYKMIKENDKYHNVYTLRDKDGNEFTNLVEINTLELPKLPNNDDNSDLWNWMKFLKSQNEEEFKMVETKSKELKKAVCVLRELSQDEKTKLIFEAHEIARMDYEDRMDGAFADGKAKGLKEGERKGRIAGERKGRIEGKIEGKIESAITMIAKYHIGLKSAMNDFELDEKYKEQIVNELNRRNINYEE